MPYEKAHRMEIIKITELYGSRLKITQTGTLARITTGVDSPHHPPIAHSLRWVEEMFFDSSYTLFRATTAFVSVMAEHHVC